MKRNLLVFAAGITILSLQSCEEKGVLVNMGGNKSAGDTSYTTTPETPQNRRVLIEEFTGASCTNCPQGHAVVKSLSNTYPDRIVAIAYHINAGGTVFKPVGNGHGDVKSVYDFRTEDGSNVASNIYLSVGYIPSAGIDRILSGTTILIDRPDWSDKVASRISVPTPLNMYLTSEYDADKNEVTVTVKAAYTQSVSKKQRLTVGVVESNISDAQLWIQDGIDSSRQNYTHNHIFRKSITAYNGSPVLDSVTTKQPGRVFQSILKFTPDASWKLENCKIVAFIANAEGDKEVAQSVEADLK